MDWFGAGVDGPLIAIRAIHFAATAVTAGSLVFRTVVAEPVLRSEQAAAKWLQTQTQRVAWMALAVTIASAVFWLSSSRDQRPVARRGHDFRSAADGAEPDAIRAGLRD